MFELKQCLIVLGGGGLGALSRYILTTLITGRFGSHFPFGTLFVNGIGCFVMGFFMILTTERFLVSPNLRLLVTVGFLGGLTTFSSFSFETMQLLRDGNLAGALLNVGGSVLIGLVSVWIGMIAARAV